MGIIISSFPGCGKTYLMNTHGDKAKMLDALELMGEGQEGEYDYNKWVDSIMDAVGDYDIVFIPVSERLLDVLNKRNIDYDIFYPSKERRGEFIENMVRKRAFRNDIMMLDRDFDKIVDRIDNIEAENCYKHKMNEQGHFIGNDNAIMQYINNIKQNPARNEQGMEESSRGEEADEESKEGNA
jgi:hypothetical protein